GIILIGESVAPAAALLKLPDSSKIVGLTREPTGRGLNARAVVVAPAPRILFCLPLTNSGKHIRFIIAAAGATKVWVEATRVCAADVDRREYRRGNSKRHPAERAILLIDLI